MLIGLGTGSTGTAEFARVLGLPHEKHWLPWEVDLHALDDALPEIARVGGEVALYFLPYVEAILERHPDTRFICMQRDAGRTVRGLSRKLGANPFAVDDDARRFMFAFPRYEAVTLAEGAARFYRDYYARAYDLQRRFPDRFAVVFTDHLLMGLAGEEIASEIDLARLRDLGRSVAQDFHDFCNGVPDEKRVRESRSEDWGWVA